MLKVAMNGCYSEKITLSLRPRSLKDEEAQLFSFQALRPDRVRFFHLFLPHFKLFEKHTPFPFFSALPMRLIVRQDYEEVSSYVGTLY